MIQELFVRNIFINVLAGLCGLGFVIRIALDLIYKRLVKASDNMGATNNKSMKHTKLKFETCYKLKIGVNNVDTFVDKNLFRYRFCGILLSTWENLSGQVMILSIMIVPVCLSLGLAFECGNHVILLTCAVGILTSSFLVVVDKSINLNDKKLMIKLNMLDYLENFCKVRLEKETFHPELLEQYRREFFEPLQTNRSFVNVAAVEKDELNRRREARKKKEEEKRVLELKKVEEQRKLEGVRLEEEKKRIEEKKKLAAKRREEEQVRIEEEKEALEARQLEVKRKADEKREALANKRHEGAEKGKLLHNIEEQLVIVEDNHDMDMLLESLAEMAAEQEDKKVNIVPKQQASVNNKAKISSASSKEDKLIEDVLKEFFA